MNKTMTSAELREIKKRFKYENENISSLVGCYVNENREIISRFRQDITRMGNEEGGKALAAFKRVLSGKKGSTGYDIEFDTSEVTDGESHKLLMDLRDSKLNDDELVEKLFTKIAEYLDMDSNYIIMACCDSYDVFSKDKNDDFGDSEEVFRYFTVAVCPVKQPNKPLMYSLADEKFEDFETGWHLSAPEAGFMFPAFDDRSTNIYAARYFAKNPDNIHADLIHALFNAEPPHSSVETKLGFNSAVKEALHEDWDMDMYFGIQDRVVKIFDEQSETGDGKVLRDASETVKVTKSELSDVLRDCGASPAQTKLFEEYYDEEFGESGEILADSIIDRKKLKIETDDVMITVAPDKTDLIETRVIDGVKYIMIKATEGVSINGLDVTVR